MIFKSCAGCLTNPVHHLLSLSLRSQKIPLQWHTHTVIPVFKSGDKSSVINYRPISLLCIISKVLEKLVYPQVFKFLYPSLSCHQFGFIPGYSYLQQLLLYTHELIIASNNHCDTDAVYLDYHRPSIQCHIMNCYKNYGSIGSQVTFGHGLRHT